MATRPLAAFSGDDMHTVFVISGVSRGLGAALAQAVLARGDRLIGISRTPSPLGVHIAHDLAQPTGLAEKLAPRLRAEITPPVRRYVLVNNAGVLAPIGTDYDAADIERNLMVNLAASIALSRAFLDILAEVAADKLVVNISSGAATRPFHGWSLYCAAKAGLEHFGRCLALEQQTAAHPADVVSISPGVIDTDMQAAIRAARPEQFPDLPRFQALHAGGALATPDAIADKLLAGIDAGARHAGVTLAIDDFAAGRATPA